MTTLSHDLVSNQRWQHIEVTAGHQEHQLDWANRLLPTLSSKCTGLGLDIEGSFKYSQKL